MNGVHKATLKLSPASPRLWPVKPPKRIESRTAADKLILLRVRARLCVDRIDSQDAKPRHARPFSPYTANKFKRYGDLALSRSFKVTEQTRLMVDMEANYI
jgi:hypothetical protein